ncbi:hypothetical protein PMAYCL1PPCAC_06769, partial [Pristionchus mayeri]
ISGLHLVVGSLWFLFLGGICFDCGERSSHRTGTVCCIQSRVAFLSVVTLRSNSSVFSILSCGASFSGDTTVPEGTIVSLISITSDLSGQSSWTLGTRDSDLVFDINSWISLFSLFSDHSGETLHTQLQRESRLPVSSRDGCVASSSSHS